MKAKLAAAPSSPTEGSPWPFELSPKFIKFLETWELRLGLTSPDYLFRRNLLVASQWYSVARRGTLARAARTRLVKEKKLLSELREHLQCLLELLPDEHSNEVQAMLVRRVFVGDAPADEHPDKVRRFFELRAGLQELLDKATTQSGYLEKTRIPPNEQYGGERVLARDLALTFRERLGKEPRDHIRGNTEKDSYSGLFFEFADAVFKQLKIQQSVGARGRMLVHAADSPPLDPDQLRTHQSRQRRTPASTSDHNVSTSRGKRKL
jgi:hypothetical protein